MSFFEAISSSIISLGELLVKSLNMIQRIIYTNGRTNPIGWLLIIWIIITIVEVVTGMLFETDFVEEGEDDEEY